MAFEPIEPTLTMTLPDTPEGEARAPVMNDQTLQIGQQAGDYIYLFTFAKNVNAPDDITKSQFVKSVEIMHATTGEAVLVAPRAAPFVALYDPQGIGTPPEDTPEVQILRDTVLTCKNLQQLVEIETTSVPLHDRLAALVAGGG